MGFQFLPQAAPKGPSTAKKFSNAVGAGLETGGQMMQEYQKKQQMQQENEAAKNLGFDLTGITDPKMRQQAFAIAMQGGNQQQLELLKQYGKQQQLGQKQDFLSQLFGGGKENQQGSQETEEQSQEVGMPQGFDPSKISDADIVRATAVDPNLGRVLQQQKDVAIREQREEKKFNFEREKLGRKEETEISKPILLEMNQIRKNIPLQEQAILDIKEASPKVSALDYFADVTGFEPLRTAEGAKLKTGIKDFFLSDLTRAGARPNQWIEQQLADALPKIGRSPEANLITAEGLQFKTDLAKKRLENIDRLAKQDRKKFGFVKADIDSRAYNDMKKYVIDRQKELQDRIKKIKAQNKGKKNFVSVISPDGSIYEIQSDDIDEAMKHGYKLQE